MLERRVETLSAKSIFFHDYNDIDIYVEDEAEGYRKIYKEILNKIFDGKLKVEYILPLGSRNNVIKECGKNQNLGGRKRLYIIDGDLYLINGNDNKTNGLKGLFVLPRYCIENYLIDEKAITEVFYIQDNDYEREILANKIDFPNWISANETKLFELFVIYAICNKLNISNTVSYKVYQLYSTNNDEKGLVCETKNAIRIEELSKKIIAVIGEENFLNEKRNIIDKIGHERNKMIRYVSGKDYLFPLLIERIKTIIKITSSNLNIKMRLSQHCDVNELSEIHKYIIE